ncbi:hypothetical protein YC2023_062831 [Brassica napus]
MISLSFANKPLRPLLGQAVCRWPFSPHVKHRNALVRAGGRVSGAFVAASVVRLFPRVPDSVPAVVLLSSVVVLLRCRLFPVHEFVVNFVCCSTNNARCLASATDEGSNWCNMVCNCCRRPAIKRATS